MIAGVDHYPQNHGPAFHHAAVDPAFAKKALLTAAFVAAVSAFVFIGCSQIKENRITLRDPDETLSFLQNFNSFLRAIFP